MYFSEGPNLPPLPWFVVFLSSNRSTFTRLRRRYFYIHATVGSRWLLIIVNFRVTIITRPVGRLPISRFVNSFGTPSSASDTLQTLAPTRGSTIFDFSFILMTHQWPSVIITIDFALINGNDAILREKSHVLVSPSCDATLRASRFYWFSVIST